LPARNETFGCGDRGTEIAVRDNILPQRPKGPETGSANPGTNDLSELDGKYPVRRDWMVEIIWTKLAARHAIIETSLRNSFQERNFVLQRPGGETGSFGSIAGAETALTREFGRHIFEIAALLRVSQRFYN
jgi:hypothetical protein